MTPEQKKYILENSNELSAKDLARRLNLKERKIIKLLEREKQKHKLSRTAPESKTVGLPFFLLTVSILCFIGFLIYSNSFQAGFYFDDSRSIQSAYPIRDISNLLGIWNFSKTRFLTYLSFALNYHFGKFNVFGYHLVNLVIHVLTSLAVYFFVFLTFKTPALAENPAKRHKELLAFLCSLIFVTHPIQTQAVTYISQRAAVLATFFYVLTVILYVLAKLRQKTFYYPLAWLTTVGAMLTKEISFTLPLTLFIYEIFFFPGFKKDFKKRLLILLPFLLTLIIIPGFVVMKYGMGSDSEVTVLRETARISRMDYLLTQINVVRTYLRLLFLPLRQNFDYAYPISRSFLEPETVLSFLLHAGLLVFAFKTYRKHKMIAFGILWFFVTLSIESSIIPIRDVIYEHRLYLPLVGFVMALCYGLYLLLQNSKTLLWVVGILAIIFSILTYQRNNVWKDGTALWEDALKKSPNKERPYHNLGIAYHRKGDLDKAIEYYQKALEINPNLGQAYNALGAIYGQRGDHTKAIDYFKKAIELDKESFEAYVNLGMTYLYVQRDYANAMTYFKTALTMDPNNPDLLYHLGVASSQTGDREKALQSASRLRELDRADLADKLEQTIPTQT